jgi:GNAT superfamily N-acetyltransferase
MIKHSIRPIHSHEVPILFEMLKSLIEFEGIFPIFKATEETLKEDLFSDPPRGFAFFLLQDEEPIGFSMLSILGNNLCYHRGRTLYGEEFYIKPEYRNLGLGKKFMQYMVKFGIDRGCDRMDWFAVKSNHHAIQFYENLGAKKMEDVYLFRLEGEALKKLAIQN